VIQFRLLLLCVFAFAFSGCAYKADLISEPVEIQGKLTKSGQPLGDVTLMLQPLQVGHPVPMKVSTSGAFKGSVVPGKYAYFLVVNESSDPASQGSIDASLKEANMQRTVTVEPGQTTLNVEL